ncbi:MAG: tetratricopeptide repeat protein [Nannocystaceae bacterium]
MAITEADHDDAEYTRRLSAASEAIEAGQLVAAARALDSIIAHYEAEHVDPEVRNYTARNQVEAMAYLLRAAAEGPEREEGEPRDARVLAALWGDAYYLRGYVSVEKKDYDDAERWLQKAVALAPMNSRYLAELGHIYTARRDWPNAVKTFEGAWEAADLSPEEIRVGDKTRALRGVGYVLIETGELDKAKLLYEECLKLNPRDAAADRELQYIEQLKARQGGPG